MGQTEVAGLLDRALAETDASQAEVLSASLSTRVVSRAIRKLGAADGLDPAGSRPYPYSRAQASSSVRLAWATTAALVSAPNGFTSKATTFCLPSPM